MVRLRSSPYGLLRTDPTAGAHGSPPAGPNTRTDLHTPSTLPEPVELIEQRSTGRRQPYDPRRDPHWRLYLTVETTMANRETHILNPAWPGLVGLCGRRVADDELVCASAPESGPLSYRRETTVELDELRRRVPPR